MKINITELPEQVKCGHSIKPGNVYQNQRGNIYVVVAVVDGNSNYGDKVVALVVDQYTGEITNSVAYGSGYFSRRPLVGIATNLPQDLDIEWNF